MVSYFYLGIDLGGTGSRMGIWHQSSTETPVMQLDSAGVQIGPNGSNIAELAFTLITEGLDWIKSHGEGSSTLAGIGVGASGASSLITDQAHLVEKLSHFSDCPFVALSADVLTAHLGALEGLPGAVVAVGTGSIALGTNFGALWRRVDGYGHLIGDRGSGAWIGMQALQAAVLFADDIDPRGSQIFELALDHFGPISQWPQALYTLQNRAGVLASFAHSVINLAEFDAKAAQIVEESAAAISASLLSALPEGLPTNVSGVGGIMKSSIGMRVKEIVTDSAPHLKWVSPKGSPLHGAGILARLARGDFLTKNLFPHVEPLPLLTHDPFVWVHSSHPAQPQ